MSPHAVVTTHRAELMLQHRASSYYHTLPVQWIFLGAQVKHAHPENLAIGQMLEPRMLSSTCFTSIRKQHGQDPPPGPCPVTWTGSCLTQRPGHPVWAAALLHRRAVHPNRSPGWTHTAEHRGRWALCTLSSQPGNSRMWIVSSDVRYLRSTIDALIEISTF